MPVREEFRRPEGACTGKECYRLTPRKNGNGRFSCGAACDASWDAEKPPRISPLRRTAQGTLKVAVGIKQMAAAAVSRLPLRQFGDTTPQGESSPPEQMR